MLKHLLRGGGSGLDGNSWVATLGGSSYDYCRSVAVAPDGSVYVCGATRLTSQGNNELLLAKFSSSGTVQWQKTLGGGRDDYGESVAVAPDGSVYVFGHTYSAGVGECDFLLVKFSSSGTVQWQKTLGGGKGDYGQSVAVAPDGSVYVCGFTYSAGAGEYDFFLAKYSSSGTVQWYKTLGGGRDDECYSVAVAPDGSVYVCGIARSARDAGGSNFLFAKFSSSGTVQWQKALGDSSHSTYGRSVAVAPDGSIYVCGNTASAGAGVEDFLLAKITDSIIEKDTVTLGIFTFQDTHLTVNNVSLTITSPGFSASNANLSLRNSSLTVGTPSLTTNLYTL